MLEKWDGFASYFHPGLMPEKGAGRHLKPTVFEEEGGGKEGWDRARGRGGSSPQNKLTKMSQSILEGLSRWELLRSASCCIQGVLTHAWMSICLWFIAAAFISQSVFVSLSQTVMRSSLCFGLLNNSNYCTPGLPTAGEQTSIQATVNRIKLYFHPHLAHVQAF